MFIDTHCHLSHEDYDNIDKVLNDNKCAGISKIVISGCTKDSIIESISFGNMYNDVYVTIGFHPSEVLKISDNDIINLEDQIKNKKVVGIGEIGLDYHYGKEDIDLQKYFFDKQLCLAEKYDLPVVIHSRDATEDTIKILQNHSVKGVIHCFSGSVETAKEYIKMGFLLGIGGVVTFKNSNLGKVVEEVGLNNIVLETDSPYLTPVPYRGEQNSSKYIPLIAEKIAEILNVTLDDVSKISSFNACELFDL